MIQNTARPRGRPRGFDETGALEKATQVFRSKGYDGVTIDDLVAGMGVGRPSLYAVFGDKRTIFLRVLRAYAEAKGALAAKALLSPRTLRDSLAAFLRHAVKTATEKGAARGCLLVCVAPLVDDAEVRQFLQNAAAHAVGLVGGSYFLTSQVIDLACGKPDCGFVYWVQAMGMARRSKAFCWRGVGRVRTVKGRSGAMAVTTVLRARVARSASRLWKLWTGAPSAVLPVAFLATARGERCALATGLSRNAAAASLSSSS